ncbi:MAG: hypothetical protein H7Z16_17910 [Pyrinomonadaceae bacterium]|nr:hypothetical protein [Pyrinomonadaceae bacterium]
MSNATHSGSTAQTYRMSFWIIIRRNADVRSSVNGKNHAAWAFKLKPKK